MVPFSHPYSALDPDWRDVHCEIPGATLPTRMLIAHHVLAGTLFRGCWSFAENMGNDVPRLRFMICAIAMRLFLPASPFCSAKGGKSITVIRSVPTNQLLGELFAM